MQFNLDLQKTKQSYSINEALSVDIEYAILNPQTTIPSKACFYQHKSLFVRGFRFKEQLEASQIAHLDDDFIAFQSALRLYKECIKIPNLDFENILEDDFSTLSLWVTFITNPEQKYTLSFHCEQCKAHNTITITPEKIDLKDYDVFENQVLDCEFGKLIVSPATMQGILDRFNLRHIPTMKIAKYIKSLNGVELQSENDKLDLLRMFNQKDFLALQDAIFKFSSGFNAIDCVCEQCKAHNAITPHIDLVRGLP